MIGRDGFEHRYCENADPADYADKETDAFPTYCVSPESLEESVQIHRFLYYVLANPVLSDYEYDLLETKARRICPAKSPVHFTGSDLAESYPQNVREAARVTHRILYPTAKAKVGVGPLSRF